MLLGWRRTLRQEAGKRHLLREDACFLRGGMFSGRTCTLREETLSGKRYVLREEAYSQIEGVFSGRRHTLR